MKSSGFKAVSLIIALVLSACNSGGGGGGPAPATGVSGVTLGGSAVKGIIKNGVVKAEELNADKSVKAQVGSATTGADGSYSLTVNSSYTGGPIQITITADATTEMKCDVPPPANCGTRSDGIADSNTTVDFGEWYKPGVGNLTMTALVAEAATDDTLSVNVTPFTDMATRRAKEAATLDKTAVYDANSEVSVLLGGINILDTKPLDITNPTSISEGSATEKAYAALAAAIATLADSSSGKPDINGALDTLASSFTGGAMMADDGGTDASVISLKEIIDGAKSVLDEAGTVDTSGAIITNMQDALDSASGGVVDPEPSPTSGPITVDKIKTFVADVRTWGTVIDSELSTKANAFSDQADLASTAANASGELLMSPALNNVVEAIGGYIDGTYSDTDLSTYGLGFTSGTISSSGSTYTITDGVYDNGSGQTVTINLTGEVPLDGTTASSFTLGITSATLNSDAADAVINSGTITLTTASGYTIDWSAINDGTAAEPDISGGSIDFDLSLTQKQDQTGAPLAATVTFTGKLAVTLTNPIKDTNGDYIWITPKTLVLSGGASSSDGNSLDFTLSANVTNADTFVPHDNLSAGYVKSDIITWTYSDTDTVAGNDTFTLTSPILNATVVWDSVSGNATITQSYSDGYVYHNTSGPYASLTDALTGSSVLNDAYNNFYYSGGYIWIDGEGGYTVDITASNFAVDGSVDGVLVDPDFVLEDSTHWLDASVGLSFNLQLTDLPKASVTISADRTDYQSGNATLTIVYGTRKIAITGDFTDSTATGSVDVTNQDGVTMTISGADLDAGTGSITYNGTTYATITSMSNGLTKISYSDGTFETL